MTLDNLDALKKKIADDFAQLKHVRNQMPFVRVGGKTFEMVSVSGEDVRLTDLDILSCSFNLNPVVLD